MKKHKIIKITETEACTHLKRYIDECDGDELARLLGDIFGGECNQNNIDITIYDFIPNQYYSFEFNYLKKEKNV